MFKKLLSHRVTNNEEYSLDSAWQNKAAEFDPDIETTRCLGARPRTPEFRTVDPLEVDINCALACADMAMTVSYPEVLEIAIRKLDHVLSSGTGALEMDEVKIITEHRDYFAARLQKLLTTDMKSLGLTRDLLQTTYSAAKAPHSGLERRKSDINLGFTRISNKEHFYIIAFESLSNLL